MIVRSVKTHKITDSDKSITDILDRYLVDFPNKSVLGIAAKIVSITEGRIVPVGTVEKDELVARESEMYIPRTYNPYGFCFSIAHRTLIASAGVDESNAFGNYVLWPKNPGKSADRIREYLVRRFKIKYAGVVIVDGHTMPFRWGVSGISIAHSGFSAIKWNKGKPDIFGRIIQVSNQSIVEGLAATASVVMGEAGEQTPLAVITDVPFVDFQSRNPTKRERASISISHKEDLYWPIIKKAPWVRGKKTECSVFEQIRTFFKSQR